MWERKELLLSLQDRKQTNKQQLNTDKKKSIEERVKLCGQHGRTSDCSGDPTDGTASGERETEGRSEGRSCVP